MQLNFKKTSGVPFARKAPYVYDKVEYQADLKDGDIVPILDGGVEEEGNWGKQVNFKIKTRNGDKKMGFNQATINVLVTEFGGDTSKWIGKEVKVILQKKLIGGKKSIVAYLVTEGWSLDEYGELVKEGAQKPADDDIDTIEYPDEKIDAEEIPF